VRLLPIVIFAAAALLLFKGVGILTSGGYVLTGTTTALASGAAPAPAEDAPAGALTPATEPTMTDTSPTLDDGAPTLAAAGAAEPGAEPGHEPAADGDHPAAPAAATDPAHAGDEAATTAPTAPDIACPAVDRGLTRHEIGAAISDATKGEEVLGECPDDPRAEGVPKTKDSNGNHVPLSAETGTPPTEASLLERLAQRRAELDAQESELSMREALVAAAEKRIDERTAALQQLEQKINALVDEKKAMEEGEFKALVVMYEGMKPAEAATIFNDLDLNVLLRIARAMSPRKMAPIMAKMSPGRAQQLTVHMADAESGPAAPQAGDLASLPQIVGQ
jgi:flagellar motility protein MotE (MotC chaperone)